jgi:hypothetical protein
MSDKRIFISCGQATEVEKGTGILLKALVDAEPGFSAYFAETVHDLEALAQHVLKGLQECAGAIVVLQDRGRVLHSDNTEWGHRSSVWVNQEVAILAYRQFFESTHLPVLAFADPRVKLEGAMTTLIVNPQPLPSVSQLQPVVSAWLRSGSFAESTQAGFLSKWEQLSDSARRVVVALVDEGGQGVKESSIRQILRAKFGLDPNTAGEQLQEAKLHFMNTDLVKLIANFHSGPELSLNPTWQFALRRQCAAWSRSALMSPR